MLSEWMSICQSAIGAIWHKPSFFASQHSVAFGGKAVIRPVHRRDRGRGSRASVCARRGDDVVGRQRTPDALEGELARRLAAVAACCSTDLRRSRLSSATSVSARRCDGRVPAGFDEVRLLDFDDFGRRDRAGLSLALERRFIACPRSGWRCPD